MTKALRHKKFIDDGNGDCVYCHEISYDCHCGEETATSLGYHYDRIVITKSTTRPPVPEELSVVEIIEFLFTNPTSQKEEIGIWRKENKWFKNSSDLVDYHNNTGI